MPTHSNSPANRRPSRPMSAFIRGRQEGMTTLGLIILVSFLGIFAFGVIRLTPVYLNYFKVAGVIDGAFKEFDGKDASAGIIRNYVARRFDIESVSQITARDIKVSVVDGGFEVRAQYSHKAPFISNINFLVEFDKSAVVRR